MDETNGLTEVLEQDEARPEPTAEERSAIDAAKSGYSRVKGVRAAQAPAPKPQEAASETPPADSPAPAPEASAPAAPEPNPQAAPAAPDVATLSQHLTELKQQVGQLAAEAGTPSAEIRKLQGEIGSINRTLKQLAKSDDAPADLAAALAKAEEAAKEYPELVGPLVAVIKAMQHQQQSAPAQEPQPPAAAQESRSPEQIAQEASVNAAKSALLEVHPDFYEMKKTPEFQAWFKAKPAEYQSRIQSTWNPAVLAAMADEHKASLKRKAENTKRLEGAVTPKGTAATVTSSAPSELDLARQGYAKQRSKRL